MENSSEIAKLIQSGDSENIKTLLEKNPDLANDKTEQGISLLVFAAYCRNDKAVELIKHYKLELDIYEHIVIGNSVQVIEFFNKNPSSINSFSQDGFTPIGLACFFGHIDVVEYLIKRGADVNIASNNDFKVTPLHSACAISNFDIAELLLKNNADPNAMQQGKVTPLHSASHNGALNLVKLLLEYGADINGAMENGKTPLSMSKEKSFTKVSEYLKSQGGN